MIHREDDHPTRRTEEPADDCRRVSEHLHAYVEQELDPIRANLAREHIGRCEACRLAVDDLESERRWFLETAMKSPALSDSFTGKILDRIRVAQEADLRRARRAVYLRTGFGAAAALLVAATAFVLLRTVPERVGPELSRVQPHATPVVLARAGASDLASPPSPRRSSALPRAIPSIAPALEGASGRSADFHLTRAALAPTPRSASPNFGNVIGMAAKLAPSEHLIFGGLGRDDPCRPDPNKDGKTDIIDVAYSCQVLLVGQPPSALEIAESRPTEASDCDESCLRA